LLTIKFASPDWGSTLISARLDGVPFCCQRGRDQLGPLEIHIGFEDRPAHTDFLGYQGYSPVPRALMFDLDLSVSTLVR
jgi:hypothetical protein